MKTILSLCDFSGNWPRPYAEAGYRVILVDPKHTFPPKTEFFPGLKSGYISTRSVAVQELLAAIRAGDPVLPIHGILAAPPCTHLSVSGAQYWAAKDADGRTAAAVDTVQCCLDIIEELDPAWWALENPVGRLPKLLPSIGKPWYFQPHWYGDPYTKKTGLWGNFNRDLPRNDVEPVRSCSQGSWVQRYGGSSERTKEARSMTPPGFARAFFEANP